MVTIAKRTLVRIISFSTAIIAALGVFSFQTSRSQAAAKQQLQYSYLRAIEDLAYNLDNIKHTLNKGMYANSPDMLNQLSGKLWNDASSAKLSMSTLPMDEIDLSSTYKFLSQVGNYAKALSQKFNNDEALTEEDKQNIVQLHDYAQAVADSMWEIESQVQGGYLTFDRTANAAMNAAAGGDERQVASVTNGFAEIESSFDSYPTLIYDGPFSDHIMQKNPVMLKGLKAVDMDAALARAKVVSGTENLSLICEEEGKMPSYVFGADHLTVSITKKGALFAYLLNYRDVQEETLTVEKAEAAAEKFLTSLGMTAITSTYHEIQHGVCIFNFAAVEGSATLYTDLIKVGVALDNGEIMSYDARGYITNHVKRHLPTPTLSRSEAAAKVSKELRIRESKLCVIPSEGLNEQYCYEFLCENTSGQNLLVYINAETGREEQILILKISDRGVLTV